MMARLTKGVMSSEHSDWVTPRGLFNKLNAEFGFTCDVCASAENTMCDKYYDEKTDGLSMDWSQNRFNWMNPPYGSQIGKWMKKACKSDANVVCLVPARTDTGWWHNYVMGSATEVRFIRGRVKFSRDGGEPAPAPFPSAIVVYRAGLRRFPTMMSVYERE